MAAHRHRRQVLLFLAAVLLPCVALVGLGVRLVVQERELARARLGDDQRRVATLLRQELASTLERTTLGQAGAVMARPGLLASADYGDPVVALVARAHDGRLVLPWEHDDRPAESRRLLDQEPFASYVRAGERAEFAAEDPASAVAGYRRALDVAEHPVQSGHARLFLARTLLKVGRQDDALAEYGKVAVAGGVVDRHGIPISLYAAGQLLSAGVADSVLLAALRQTLAEGPWPTPAALYLLRDLADDFVERGPAGRLERAGRQLTEDVARQLARTEHALALARDLPALGLGIGRPPPPSGLHRWVLHGEPPWLVGTAPVPEGDPAVVVAVRPEPVLASLEAGRTASPDVVGEVVAAGGGPGAGELMGARFPGLAVRFNAPRSEPVAATGTARWWFYAAGLALVLGVTLFGAYLLWRDTRREVALAETRSRFVAAVSHELKTPLSAIRLFAETLQMGRPAAAGARREYLETIVSESERLTRLLNNVLDFSTIEGDRKTYHRQPHSLAAIVRFSARTLQYPLEQQRFALRLEIDDDLPPARVDRDAIEQAILNLLGNAMKYSGESREIELRLRSADGAAVIEVADHGVGIEEAEQARIFERFHRVTSATGNGVPGAGLGLTLVQHIAEAHGGRVAVESAPGQGSTFSLFIPLEGAEP